ncbi:hypothetical protein CKAH01_11374 [Colletotrichum kahawae]|uniref:Uncharacterized protein n=1 Tax=Colletotrichum kahawae TaxID=34407 RepID=A0AAD9YTV5_COLKA|nr:hypothetical protein CKAH01_11374 [Colletotrichum kahawae]
MSAVLDMVTQPSKSTFERVGRNQSANG